MTQEKTVEKLQIVLRCVRRLPDSLDEKRTILPIVEEFLALASAGLPRQAQKQPEGFDKTAAFQKTGEPQKVDTVVERATADVLKQADQQIIDELTKDNPATKEVVTDGEE